MVETGVKQNKQAIYRTMSEIATDGIREAILLGKYPPGMRLIPSKMEKELNIGRVAIREALCNLSGSGLIVNIPNKGAIVSRGISSEELREVWEIRFDLEGRATELATQRISEEEIVKLEKINSDMSGHLNDFPECFFINKKFHLDLYKASGWDFLCQIIDQLFEQILIYRCSCPFLPQMIPHYIEEHNELLTAVRARDGKSARKILIRHLKGGIVDIIAQIPNRDKKTSASRG